KIGRQIHNGSCCAALAACSRAPDWPIVLFWILHCRMRSGSGGGLKKHMRSLILCAQCDLPEEKCLCDRYCCYCQGQQGIRLCMDGKYYCLDCREACEIHVAGTDDT